MEAEAEGLILPPWAAYLGKRLASMWFKQGSGEAYCHRFQGWWDAQPAEVRARVIALYPEPPEWEGFYAHSTGETEPGATADPADPRAPQHRSLNDGPGS